MVVLQRFLYEMYDCTNIVVFVNCNDTGGAGTVYSVQFVRPMADDLLNTWLMVGMNSDNKIELGVSTFTLCNQTCDGGVVTDSNVMPGNAESSLHPSIIVEIIIITIIAAAVIVIISALLCYYK